MTITDYLQKPISEIKRIVTIPVGIKDPLWMERLKTAVENSNPIAVSFDKRLLDLYWTIKESA